MLRDQQFSDHHSLFRKGIEWALAGKGFIPIPNPSKQLPEKSNSIPQSWLILQEK